MAPPIEQGEATSIADGTSFLYTGPDPIQSGVTPGAIDPERVAVLRGRVLDDDGNGLPSVTIRVVDHPELGHTVTRVDGRFDMAVNGGEELVVDYERPEFMGLQRTEDVPWQQFVDVEDVVMKRYDSRVTTVDTDQGDPFQVATGSPVTDGDGSRQATLLFKQGTDAVMELPDGTTQPLDDLEVRATEYTVGADGDEAMPGELPETSAYTYAVEFSVDEAVEAGATDVRFDKPVISYLDNFLGFPAGTRVPAAHYDRERGVWVPANDGIVLEIIGAELGFAIVDTDGDGLADSEARLRELGITNDERSELHTRYPAVGTSLWRVQVRHFTPWDYNWPYGCEDPDCEPPNQTPPPPPPCPDCEGEGSVIGFYNQTLGEYLPLTGTPFRLRYSSDRAPGYKEAFAVEVPLSGGSVGGLVRGIAVSVSVAGREFTEVVPPGPNLKREFIWDGKDAYGRTVQGAQTAQVRVGYMYRAVYMEPRAFAASFARIGGRPLSANRARQQITAWQQWERPVGTFRVGNEGGIGGWTLDVHHAYDPQGQVLYRGDGSRLTTEAIRAEILTVAGIGLGDEGTPATETQLGHVRGVAVGADGSMYIADTGNGVVHRVTREGGIATVAGGGTPDDGLGDGGPATDAQLIAPSDVEPGPDGGFYISDTGNGRIRYVNPAGIITTVAGGGESGALGDDGPATKAFLKLPRGIVLAADGSLYVADSGHDRVRQVTPDGRIATVVGGGSPADGLGDGGLAPDAALALPVDVALTPNGDLLVADALQRRIRRMRADGTIDTVAGNGGGGYGGDGGSATSAQIGQPQGLDVARDGTIFLVDRGHHVVRKVTTDGFISTYAGTGRSGAVGEGAPPLQANFTFPEDVATTATGAVVIADSGNFVVRRAAPSLPGFADVDLTLPSDDGREVYLFTESGRHLRTLDALSGALVYEFGYDSAGRLISITDGDGQKTTIERAPDGMPTAVVAPGGQRSTLSLLDGYLTGVTNPAGEQTEMAYAAGGLLTTLTSPEGGVHNFVYDARGRLIRDEDAGDGFTALSRVQAGATTTVTATTALGRNTQYVVQRLPNGDTRREVIAPTGARSEFVTRQDGSTFTKGPDGSELETEVGPDPRWGMRAPVLTKLVRKWPSGRTNTVTHSRNVTLLDETDLFSIEQLFDTTSRNGRVSQVTYNGATRTATTQSAGGRESTEVFDARGRIVSRQIAPGTEPIHYEYDALGRPSAVRQGTQSQTFTYDAANRLAQRTDALGKDTLFEYDAADRVTKMTLPSGREYDLAYDDNGNRTGLTMPNGAVHTFAFSALDQPVGYTPPGNPAYTRQFDADRLMTTRGLPTGRSIARSYDAGGRVVGQRDLTGTALDAETVFTFTDGTSRPAATTRSFTGGPSQETRIAYDGTHVLSRELLGSTTGRFAYTYDSNGFLTRINFVSGADTVETAFMRDSDGLATRIGPFDLARHGPSGAESAITDTALNLQIAYDLLARPTTRTHTVAGSQAYRLELERNAAGRITRRTETLSGTPQVRTYSYDDDGQLVRVADGGGTPVEQYAYDQNGNRTSGGAAYDAQDRLTSLNGVAYTFDADGFLTSRGDDDFRYSAEGELLEATVGGQTVRYAYDAAGRRVARIAGASRYEYFYGHPGRQLLVTAARSPSGVLSTYYYDDRGFLFAILRGGQRYYVATDQVGSPRVVTNAAGTVLKTIEYDSFGEVLTVGGTDPSFDLPFGFAGGLADELTGLVHFAARDYDPQAGRWTARDPILFESGSANLYAYAKNDPVNSRDPSGLFELPTMQQVGQFFSNNWERAVDTVNSLDIDSKVLDASRWLKDKFDKGKKVLDVQEEVQETILEAQDAEGEPTKPEQGAAWLKCGLRHLKKILPLDLVGIDLATEVLDTGVDQSRDSRDHEGTSGVHYQKYMEAFNSQNN